MTEITIFKTPIRRDDAGRFCLNDLHRAAGARKTHQPSNWLRLDMTDELIAEISKCSDVRSKPLEAQAGRYGGTYAVKELVYAYAMWISPKLHLAVIRAFDAMVSGQASSSPPLPVEHPLVAQFWNTYEALVERGEHVNYSGKPGLIAIHLTTLLQTAWRRGLSIGDRSKLTNVLKTSMRYAFIGHEDVSFHGRRIPKCWIFRDTGGVQTAAYTAPLRLTDAATAAPDIVFSQTRYELAGQCTDIALRVGAAANALAGVGEALRKNAMETHQAMTLLSSVMRDLHTHLKATDAEWR